MQRQISRGTGEQGEEVDPSGEPTWKDTSLSPYDLGFLFKVTFFTDYTTGIKSPF